VRTLDVMIPELASRAAQQLLTGVTVMTPFSYSADIYLTPAARSCACASQPECRAAFPGWERQFGGLVKAWNAHPVHGRTGDEFASVVHAMLRDMEKAVSIPLVVSRAVKGDYGPFDRARIG
jgi:hypothetical protein